MRGALYFFVGMLLVLAVLALTTILYPLGRA